MTDILMPALSPTMEEGTLAKWLVKKGDTVSAGDVIAEIETDKATMEVEAVDEGVVEEILVPAGTEGVKVNAPIARLSGGSAAPAAAPPKPEPAAETPAAAQPRNDFVGVDVESALNSNPPPAYPPQAKARREEGTVQLRLQVRPDGSVGEVQVQASSGSMRLDRAAIDSVKRWKFRPATRGGQAVESWATVPITFGLRRGDRRRGHDHNSLASEQTSGDS